VGFYFATLADPIALSAIRLTLLAAAISVPLNCVFGVCAASATLEPAAWSIRATKVCSRL
jgi:ABC-type sulfate transport system permease subunit